MLNPAPRKTILVAEVHCFEISLVFLLRFITFYWLDTEMEMETEMG
jgi:hypothetical protein